MKIFTSDGSCVLPAPTRSHISLSLDCSALSHLTNAMELARNPQSRDILRWLNRIPASRLEIVAEAAILEAFYKNVNLRLEDFPLYLAVRLEQLRNDEFEMQSTSEFMKRAANILISVSAYTLCVLAMRGAYEKYGAKMDVATARARLSHFIDWSTSCPQLGTTTLVAAAMHEALKYNAQAQTAFKLLVSETGMKGVINAAWDLYQIQLMLSHESRFIGVRPKSYSVYLTRDVRLGSVFSNWGVIDPHNKIVGVTPKTILRDSVAAQMSQDAITHGFNVPTFSDTVLHVQVLSNALSNWLSRYPDEGLELLTMRLSELNGFFGRNHTNLVDN